MDATEQPVVPIPTKSRKGKGAKQRDAEKHRSTKNEVFDKKQKMKFSEARTLPTAVTAIFSDLAYSPSTRPPISFNATYTVLPQLILMIAACLRENKVSLNDNELIALCLITIKQIKVRVHRSRQGSQFPPPRGDDDEVSRVAKVFKESIFPLSHYVMQFGKVRLDNQIHIPVCDFSIDNLRAALLALNLPVEYTVPNNVVVLGEGNSLYGVPVWIQFPTVESIQIARQLGVLNPDHMLFTDAFLANPMQFQTAGLFQMRPPAQLFPTDEQLIFHSHNILSRVARKMNNCVEPIDWDAEGSLAQLATNHECNGTRVEVICDRVIPDDALVLGCILKLRLSGDCDEERIAIRADVETVGALERYSRTVLERARAS